MKSHNKLLKTSRLHICSAFIICIILFSTTLCARMTEVSETELSQVYAQAGVTYNWGNSKLNITYDSFAISDTDSTPRNWLEFNNISISGPDGYFTLDEQDPLMPDAPIYYFNTVDIGTLTTVDGTEKTLMQMVDSTNTHERVWSIGNLVFCGQDLGSIQFDARNVESTILKMATHGDGLSGIEFEYLANWEMKNFTYNYNTNGGSLNASGIHLAGYAEIFGDNPADPSTWKLSGRFRIGDIYGGTIDVDNDSGNAAVSNPATFDVGTWSDGTTSTTCAFINLPMKGTIRAEKMTFGGNDHGFGPIAIDGITAHYLYIGLNPGN